MCMIKYRVESSEREHNTYMHAYYVPDTELYWYTVFNSDGSALNRRPDSYVKIRN